MDSNENGAPPGAAATRSAGLAGLPRPHRVAAALALSCLAVGAFWHLATARVPEMFTVGPKRS